MRIGWVCAATILTTGVLAQDPIVYPQARISIDPTSVSASETTGAASAAGLEIVAGFVDFRADGTIKNSFAVSSNGGQSWAHVILRPPQTFQDALEADPMTAYDPRTNTLFAGGISRAKCIYVARKLPGQDAFSPSVVARQSSWPDKGWMAAGPRFNQPTTTRLYVTYNEGIIWSDDLGGTWTNPMSLGTGFGFLPRVGPRGELYVTYWDGYWGIKFTRSLDGGETWSAPVQPATRMASWGVENYGIPGTFRNFTNNAMAVNPATGEIVILWVDQTNIVSGQKNLDLYMVRSSDKGLTWSAPSRLPFRPLNQVSDMIFPWVEFTKDGRLHLFAMDTSLNPGQVDGAQHGFWNQVYFYSDDIGSAWSPGIRLTPSPWDSFFHGTGSANFLGDYQGMAVSDKSVYAIYPDTHTEEADTYVNKIYNPIERPATAFWNFGTAIGGSVASLFLRDGKTCRATPVWTAKNGEAAQIEMAFSIPSSSPSKMQVHVWSGAGTTSLEQVIEAKEAAGGRWTAIDRRPATASLSNTQVNIPNPSAFVSANTVRLRLTIKSVLRRPTRPWIATVDQAVLLVEP